MGANVMTHMHAQRNAAGAGETRRDVDVLVVGAGPAGASAARGLARAGLGVLLIDKARFPRWKVCGCCLNGAALQTLDHIGLGHLPARLGAPTLRHVRIAARGQVAQLDLPAGAALSRERLDEALIAEAVAAGADFHPATAARWEAETPDAVQVSLRAGGEATSYHARVVIAADGLNAGFTRQIPGVQALPARAARIGAGTVLATAPRDYARHVIHMAVGAGGYVGLVRVEDDRLDVAAAFDVDFVQAAGGLPHAATRVLTESGFPPVDGLTEARWQGTPPLTRAYRPPPSGRLFLVGDAAEYIEPFTGEGMAWALAGGAAVAPYVIAALNGAGHAAQAGWQQHSQELLGRRKGRCRWIARGLRHPRLTAWAVRMLAALPMLATPYIRTLNQPRPVRG
jgi:flavin-dependent dehydrogenase